jgi:hypothetical protein
MNVEVRTLIINGEACSTFGAALSRALPLDHVLPGDLRSALERLNGRRTRRH